MKEKRAKNNPLLLCTKSNLFEFIPTTTFVKKTIHLRLGSSGPGKARCENDLTHRQSTPFGLMSMSDSSALSIAVLDHGVHVRIIIGKPALLVLSYIS